MGMFGFLPHNLFTTYRGASSNGLSPRLWQKVTSTIMESDGSSRLFLAGDDFACVKAADTYTDLFSEMAYTSYIDTGGTITGLADEKGGVLALTTDGTDEDEIWISSGDGTQQLGQISDTAGADHVTAFECRYKISSITDSVMSHFVGLASPGLAAENTAVDATGVLKTTSSFIGFRTLLDGNSIDFIYQKASQTLVTKISGVHVPVADTFVKLGFVYDPAATADKRIKVFVDGVEQSTYVTAANIASTTSYFPDAVALSFLAGYKNTTAAAGELAIDWWSFAQIL